MTKAPDRIMAVNFNSPIGTFVPKETAAGFNLGSGAEEYIRKDLCDRNAVIEECAALMDWEAGKWMEVIRVAVGNDVTPPLHSSAYVGAFERAAAALRDMKEDGE